MDAAALCFVTAVLSGAPSATAGGSAQDEDRFDDDGKSSGYFPLQSFIQLYGEQEGRRHYAAARPRPAAPPFTPADTPAEPTLPSPSLDPSSSVIGAVEWNVPEAASAAFPPAQVPSDSTNPRPKRKRSSEEDRNSRRKVPKAQGNLKYVVPDEKRSRELPVEYTPDGVVKWEWTEANRDRLEKFSKRIAAIKEREPDRFILAPNCNILSPELRDISEFRLTKEHFEAIAHDLFNDAIQTDTKNKKKKTHEQRLKKRLEQFLNESGWVSINGRYSRYFSLDKYNRIGYRLAKRGKPTGGAGKPKIKRVSHPSFFNPV